MLVAENSLSNSEMNATLSRNANDSNFNTNKADGSTILFLVLLFMNIGATFFDGSLGNILTAIVMKKIHFAGT